MHCVYGFQAKAGAFLGFGEYFYITRQIMDAMLRRMSVPDPEVQVCRCAVIYCILIKTFWQMSFCVVCLQSFFILLVLWKLVVCLFNLYRLRNIMPILVYKAVVVCPCPLMVKDKVERPLRRACGSAVYGLCYFSPFSALTLLVGQLGMHPACKKLGAGLLMMPI